MGSSENDWCVVSGTGGYLGAAIAKQMSRRGFRVVGIDRRTPLEPEALELGIKVDLGRGPTFQHFDDIGGRLLHVIHAAGGALKWEVEGQKPTWQSVTATIQDNLVSSLELIEGYRPYFAPRSRVTLISSINSLGGYGLPVYSAAKAALHGLTRSLADDFEKFGQEIHCLTLGTVDHPGVRALHAEDSNHFERLKAQFPNRQIPSASEMAHEIVKYAIEEPEVNGKVTILDFGQSGVHHAPE